MMYRTACIITGGGSGMGLAAARQMPKEKIFVLSGRTVKKLENAVSELTALGYEAHAMACDTSRREDVRALAEYAASFGEIRNVIHAAGLSPAMAKPEQLLQVNALASLADERNGYLAGVDVLCDGGASFGRLFRKKDQKPQKTAGSVA